MAVLLNRNDMTWLNVEEGQMVALETNFTDGIERKMGGFRVTGYDIPEGCCGTYYPEANALMLLSHYATGSFTPAAKSIPVKIRPQPPG